MIVFERAGLLFIFNCKYTNVGQLIQDADRTVNATQSFTDYRVGVDVPGEYKVILSSDEKKFGGHDRIALNGTYFTTPEEWNNRRNYLQVCLPDQNVTDITGLLSLSNRSGVGTLDSRLTNMTKSAHKT